jgi:hypothetical protein
MNILASRIRWLERPIVQQEAPPAYLNLVFSMMIIIGIVFSPLLVIAFRQPFVLDKITCPEGKQAVYFPFNLGSFVRVIREYSLQLDWMPDFHRGRFSINIHNLPNTDAIGELSGVLDPSTLTSTFNLENGEYILVIAPTEILPTPPVVVRACGQISSNQNAAKYQFFYISSVAH